jgi:hypothetical protein
MFKHIKQRFSAFIASIKSLPGKIKALPGSLKKKLADRKNRTKEQKRADLYRLILCIVLTGLCFAIAPNFWNVNAGIFAQFAHIKDALVWSKRFTTTEAIKDGAGNIVQPFFTEGIPTFQWIQIHFANIDWLGLLNGIALWFSVLAPLVISIILIIHEIKYRKVAEVKETIPFKVYKKIANPIHHWWKDKARPSIIGFWGWMKSEKRVFALYGLILLFMLGWATNFILFVATWFYQYVHFSILTIQLNDASAMSDGFSLDQLKAIWYILVYCVAKIPLWGWILIAITIYNSIAIIVAYKGLEKRDEQMVDLVDKTSPGCSVSGASNTGKTRLLHGLGDASERYAFQTLSGWAQTRENQFGNVVDFKDLRGFYSDAVYYAEQDPANYHSIKNCIDASKLADEYIADRGLPADYVYWNFEGQGIKLGEMVSWYFQYLWITSQQNLVAANFPRYSTNRLGPQRRIRNNFWTFITDRREPVLSKVVNMDFFKTYDKEVIDKLNEDANNPIVIPANTKVRFLFPGVCLLLTEFGKDAFHDDKDVIVALGEDKFLSIIRHFISFDNMCIGRIYWDDQNQNAIANVIRSRFPCSLYIAKTKQCHSFFLNPIIWLVNKSLAHEEKSRAKLDKVAPYKQTVGYMWSVKKSQFFQHCLDYFSYFDYVSYKIRVLGPDGEDIRDDKAILKVGLNLRDTYNNYETVVYSDLYKERQDEPGSILWSDLPSYSGLHLTKTEAAEMHSQFVDFMFDQNKKQADAKKTGRKG